MRSVNSKLGSIGRLVALGATLSLAACGSSQNWHGGSPYVSVSGTVSGLNGGTLALWNNGQDKLQITGNGQFSFPLSIANGSAYQVLVASQPDGQTCTVANGEGTADVDVANVTVNCAPYAFTRRPLPAVYSTGKAVNYSAYRAAGPALGEVPSDADILEDLTLLHSAGYDLLRLFGVRAPGDPTLVNHILSIAEQSFPDMKFQLGIELKGLTSCSDTSNDATIAYSIGTLARHANVVAVSVGNETSFFSKYMPLSCLTGYIRTVRSQVTQPVTADDDYTFYSGNTYTGGDRVAEKPDPVLALIDFASIHMYPFSNPSWDWQQTTSPAGPDRARAMMEASLGVDQAWYQLVANYSYADANGNTVTIGDSMPIVIGETGWKARVTNPGSALEIFAARPANQKWYYDLLYGNPAQGYASWQGSAGGPLAIFWFEATDEAWKGTDDGWGLWDASRTARYVLCGNPAGPACNADLYAGAGYYIPPVFADITFDDPATTYSLTGFGGAEDSQVVADPTDPSNMVVRVNRAADAQTWAGTTVSSQPGNTVGVIPFTTSSLTMTVRTYSPAAGIPVLLKVENSSNGAVCMQTTATTTVANGWETLSFDFGAAPNGCPAFDANATYDRLSIFFNFGVDGATAGAQTYYFDDVSFVQSAPPTFPTVTFDDPSVIYKLTPFGGEGASVAADPTDATNNVAKVVRVAQPTAQNWEGTTVSTQANDSVGVIPFTGSSLVMTVRSYSPAAGVPVLLKVENSTNGAVCMQTTATTTVANAWETLAFDFGAAPNGCPAFDANATYDKVSIFFDFLVDEAADQTYYFDDVAFGP